MAIYYEDQIVSRRRVDFWIEDKVLVELKAKHVLEAEHLAQALNNLETRRVEIGLLINFGAKSLQFRRLINNKLCT